MRIKILPSLFNHLTTPSAWRTTTSHSMSDTLSFSPPDRSPGSKEWLGRQSKWEALASHRDSTSRILSPSFPSLLVIDSISFLFFSCRWYSFHQDPIITSRSLSSEEGERPIHASYRFFFLFFGVSLSCETFLIAWWRC